MTDSILAYGDLQPLGDIPHRPYGFITSGVENFVEHEPFSDEVFRELYNYVKTVERQTNGKRPFRLRSGHFGIGPEALDEGDLVVVLKGGRVPYIFSNGSGSRPYYLVGPAYVHGIMHGEFFKEKRGLKSFRLR